MGIPEDLDAKYRMDTVAELLAPEEPFEGARRYLMKAAGGEYAGKMLFLKPVQDCFNEDGSPVNYLQWGTRLEHWHPGFSGEESSEYVDLTKNYVVRDQNGFSSYDTLKQATESALNYNRFNINAIFAKVETGFPIVFPNYSEIVASGAYFELSDNINFGVFPIITNSYLYQTNSNPAGWKSAIINAGELRNCYWSNAKIKATQDIILYDCLFDGWNPAIAPAGDNYSVYSDNPSSTRVILRGYTKINESFRNRIQPGILIVDQTVKDSLPGGSSISDKVVTSRDLDGVIKGYDSFNEFATDPNRDELSIQSYKNSDTIEQDFAVSGTAVTWNANGGQFDVKGNLNLKNRAELINIFLYAFNGARYIYGSEITFTDAYIAGFQVITSIDIVLNNCHITQNAVTPVINGPFIVKSPDAPFNGTKFKVYLQGKTEFVAYDQIADLDYFEIVDQRVDRFESRLSHLEKVNTGIVKVYNTYYPDQPEASFDNFMEALNSPQVQEGYANVTLRSADTLTVELENTDTVYTGGIFLEGSVGSTLMLYNRWQVSDLRISGKFDLSASLVGVTCAVGYAEVSDCRIQVLSFEVTQKLILTDVVLVKNPFNPVDQNRAVFIGGQGTQVVLRGSTQIDPGFTTSGEIQIVDERPAAYRGDAITSSQLSTALASNSVSDRDRANHTGTQLANTISDLTETIQDAVAGFLGQGSNITLTYNDAANTFTIAAASGSQFDPEATRDAIGAALIGVGNISVVINDAADTITIATTATANSTDAQLRDRSTHTGQQPATSITGLAAVATTGSWNNLVDKPTIPDENNFLKLAGNTPQTPLAAAYFSVNSVIGYNPTNSVLTIASGGKQLYLGPNGLKIGNGTTGVELDFQPGGTGLMINGVLLQNGSGGSATTDASALTTGTLSDARLSTNVPLKNASNVYTVRQLYNAELGIVGNTGQQAVIHANNALQLTGLTGAPNSYETSNFAGIQDASVIVRAGVPGVTALMVAGAASQVGYLQDWRNSSNQILAYVTSTGKIFAPEIEMSSTTKAFLVPRVTTAQLNQITNAQYGAILAVTDGTAPGIYAIDSLNGGSWKKLAYDDSAVYAAMKVVDITNQRTANYTLALADAGKEIPMNSTSPLTVTIPTDATVAFPNGTIISISQEGTGQVTIAAASGVVLTGKNGTKIDGQYGTVGLQKRTGNNWRIIGAVA